MKKSLKNSILAISILIIASCAGTPHAVSTVGGVSVKDVCSPVVLKVIKDYDLGKFYDLDFSKTNDFIECVEVLQSYTISVD